MQFMQKIQRCKCHNSLNILCLLALQLQEVNNMAKNMIGVNFRADTMLHLKKLNKKFVTINKDTYLQ